MNPLVSVIIPTYNRRDTIVDAIKSIIKQDYRPLEIIVIDDGSFDNTKEIIKNINIEASNLTLIYIYQENQGVSSARNRGIKESKGIYISFLDSDDILLPRKISRQVKKMRQIGADISYGKTLCKSKTGIIDSNKSIVGYDSIENYLLLKDMVSLDAWMFSHELISRFDLKFRENCSWGEDCEFLIKAMIKCKKIAFINDYLIKFVVGRNDGLSKFSLKKINADYFIYNKIKQWIEQQDIPIVNKRHWNSIIDNYTIPTLVLGRIWVSRRGMDWKQYFCHLPRFSFCKMFFIAPEMSVVKLLVKYFILFIRAYNYNEKEKSSGV